MQDRASDILAVDEPDCAGAVEGDSSPLEDEEQTLSLEDTATPPG